MTTAPITLHIDNTQVSSPDPKIIQNVLQALRPATVAPVAVPRETEVPALGEYWPGQGGVFAGTIRGRDEHPDYHLIVAQGAGGESQDLQWGGYSRESAATSKWDGLANTRALAESEADHPAAQWAALLEHDGKSDWYLPAQAELALAWVNVPELFSEGWHWSSSQFSAYNAWYQYFYDGSQNNDGKSYEGRARAVRRLLIQ